MRFSSLCHFKRDYVRTWLLTACFGACAIFPAVAQNAAPPAPAAPQSASIPAPPARFETQARAANGGELMAGHTPIKLWAVETVSNMSAAFNLKARAALDNAAGQSKITCDVKGRDGDKIIAQCVNKQDQDLGLLMLQQGFVTADRTLVFGTVFEDAYIQAETQAQSRGLGVWAEDLTAKGAGAGVSDAMMASFGFVIFLCLLGAFTFLSIMIMRGFQKVVAAQNQSVQMLAQERKLRDKERGIVAVMLDSELKGNKAKIEAYRAVYEEMLSILKDPDRAPKYKKSGDIIQKQPALARSVFDRNADKLDMLGARLSSELIHFYARVKSVPEYINLEPNMPVEEAVGLLEKSLKNAERLNQLVDRLLDSFASSGVNSENYDNTF